MFLLILCGIEWRCWPGGLFLRGVEDGLRRLFDRRRDDVFAVRLRLSLVLLFDDRELETS